MEVFGRLMLACGAGDEMATRRARCSTVAAVQSPAP
jgi:hypothetical protein